MTLDDQTKSELITLLKEAVLEAVEHHPLTDEEIQWVRMAIKAEAERAQLRKAIIEKTLAGLVWMAVVGLLGLAWSGLRGYLGK